jgi:hypothetical protein
LRGAQPPWQQQTCRTTTPATAAAQGSPA